MVVEMSEIDYELIDFNGYIQWAMRDDGKYAVDPLYLDKFKLEKGIK